MLMAEKVYLETDFNEYKIFFYNIVITVIISTIIKIIKTNITIIIVTTILSESSQTNCLVR